MNTTLRSCCLACCLALCLITLSPANIAAAEPETNPPGPTTDSEYTVTVIPFYGPEKIWALYSPFIDFLKESTGKPWSLKLFPTHKAVIDGLCGGQVSLALLGPVPLGRAMKQCQTEPIAIALSKDGTPFYHSVIVSADPAVTSLDKLLAQKIGFFKGSTAAHIVPRKILLQAGLKPTDYVPVFFEGQDHIINALLTRQVVAAGVKETLFAKFKDNGFRALAISGPLPNFAFAAAPGASAEIKKLFTGTLLQLTPTAAGSGTNSMAPWDDEIKNGFIPPNSAFLSSVKALLTLTEETMNENR